MNEFVRKIVLLIAAVAVFFTGAGVTIVSYCCSNCKAEHTLVMTSAHECCLQKDTAEKQHACCSSYASALDHADQNGCSISGSTHCKASRLSADIDIPSARQQIVIPFEWISDVSPVLPVSLMADQIGEEDVYAHFKSPPNIPPREYLSFIRVLVI